MPNLRPWLLLIVLPLAACDLPPPAQSALYPPDEAGLAENYAITHDRYRPWMFQPLDMMNRGR